MILAETADSRTRVGNIWQYGASYSARKEACGQNKNKWSGDVKGAEAPTDKASNDQS